MVVRRIKKRFSRKMKLNVTPEEAAEKSAYALGNDTDKIINATEQL